MGPILPRSIRHAIAALGVLAGVAGPAAAQLDAAGPSPAVSDSDRNSPAYRTSVDARMTIRPDLPVPFFNHVMLYLPEFDLYTNPTASLAAFAVFPLGSYDKPVLHISASGGRAARTPAMKVADHVSMAKTTATIAPDGTIKRSTRQTATGAFASTLRGTALQPQTQGRKKFAENLLRNLGPPGTGLFDPVAGQGSGVAQPE
jgi:hypothetical protein